MSLADGDGGTVGGEPLASGGGSGGRGPVVVAALVALVGVGMAGFFVMRSVTETDPGGLPPPVSSGSMAPPAGSPPLALACAPVEKRPDFGTEHTTAPVTYEESPPASGPHAPVTLPAEPRAYPIALTPELEWLAVHNLEHGYVLIRYRDGWVPQVMLDAFTALVNAEPEVILAGSSTLPQGVDVAFVAWRRVRPCTVAPGEDAIGVARAFIEEFRNGRLAPESQGP